MAKKRTPAQIAASKRNLEKARRAKKNLAKRDAAISDWVSNPTAKAVRAVGRTVSGSALDSLPIGGKGSRKARPQRLANGSKTGVMVPPQHARSAYTVQNIAGQTIRKRNRMDAQAVQQGYYMW